ncbi:PAS domain S-box protein [Desulfitibacter alkalitolerans]|uniref:PAS domain S-box protein n=1 Tax=Desulfitibacter alkalitolerans TaxID=264641 RepID=UPI000686C6D8|nr:PAS domain S-box protein [Desulfitibacter alkalitolerans]
MKSLRSKLAILGILPVIILFALVIFVILPSMEDDIMAERKSQTEELVGVGISILEYYYSLEEANELTREEAQEQARAAIRNVRYGDFQQDYFWINDLNHILLVHPFRPDLEGTNMVGDQDPDGVFIVAEFVKIARDQGKGCLTYKWQYYDQQDRIEPKLGCVRLFEPWEWVLGTSLYINDVEMLIANKTRQTHLITAGVLVTALFAYLLLGNHLLIKPINKLINHSKQLRSGNFTKRVYLYYEDELGQLGNTMNKLSSEIEELLNSLLSQKQHFEALFNNTTDGVVYFDTDFKIYDANIQFTKTFGYSLKEVKGKDISEITGNDDLIVYNSRDQFNLKLPVEHEGTAVTRDGQTIHVLIKSAPVIVDGKIVGGYAIYSDITERKNAETKLQESYQDLEATYEELSASEEELKAQFEELQETTESLEMTQFALDNSSDAVFWIERSGSFAYANTAASNMLGYTKEELLGKKVFDIDANIAMDKWEKHWQAVKSKGKTRHETVHRRKDGSTYPAEVFASYFYYKHKEYIFAFVTNISKRKAAEKELELQKKRYEALFLDSMDAVVFIDNNKKIQEINKRYTELFGYTLEEAKGLKSSELLSSGDEKHREEFQRIYNEITQGKTYDIETVRYSKDGRPIHVNLKGIPVTIDGEFIGAYGIYTDITERKEYEKRLKHISLHDALTGLYNRMYFEEEIKRLEGGRSYPVSIISADLDGLKLINDTMGHEKGDEMLQAAARVLEESLRKSDIIARTGGDEFSIILPNTDERVGKEIIARIKGVIQIYNQDNRQIPLSVSLGAATSKGPEQKLKETLKIADDLMYKDKLYRSSSARSQIVNSLLAALSERDFIADGHASRMVEHSQKLGERVGLSIRQLIDLALLAQVHDLGKVGIPDNILFKEGRLTKKEWEIMKQHPEKGYRIAQSSPDISGIADLILKHHEKWDGTGYPLGIKGEEIPIECRIIAIVDAFDAMTNDRPYRKAMSAAEALEEIKNQAGKQFDPYLVEKFLEGQA